MQILGMTFGEKLSTGGITVLIGMGLTFIILGLLVAIIMFMEYSQKMKIPGKKTAGEDSEAASDILEQTVQSGAGEISTGGQQAYLDEELVAVITAAITAATADESSFRAGFKVRTIKRI